MKYFYIFFISFFLAMPAYAAKQVKGDVPNVQPLQPPAVGVRPNYSKNIQYSDPSRPAPVVPDQKKPEQNVAPIQQELSAQIHKSYPWALIVTLLLGLGALYLVWKNTRKP